MTYAISCTKVQNTLNGGYTSSLFFLEENSFVTPLDLVVPRKFVNNWVHTISCVEVAQGLTVLWVILYGAYFVQGIGQTKIIQLVVEVKFLDYIS